MTLEELAIRYEQASGPDDALDWAIAEAIGCAPGLPYSASLDAAMTLVPEGWRIAEAGETVVECSDPWRVRLFEKRKHDRDAQKARGDAATFALALCAAALRSRGDRNG